MYGDLKNISFVSMIPPLPKKEFNAWVDFGWMEASGTGIVTGDEYLFHNLFLC